MRKFRFGMLSILTLSLLLVSCGKTIDEAAELAEYLESADSPYNTTSIPAIIKADAVNTSVLAGTAYVMDIRSAADFAAGHISGAVNIPAGEIVTHLDGADLTGKSDVVVVCYTGQTAGWAACLANLAGHSVKSMKWGMSSWNTSLKGSVANNSLNTNATQLVTEATAKGEAGAMPVLETGFETAEEILDAQIAEVAAAGFGDAAVTAAEVWANPDNYYIVNYWGETHYDLGHIPGAIQYTPGEDLEFSTDLTTLPTDKTVVVYCYTGQTSAFMAAYLKVMGYDAKSLKFGVNGFAHDFAVDNGLTAWTSAEEHDYDLVTD